MDVELWRVRAVFENGYSWTGRWHDSEEGATKQASKWLANPDSEIELATLQKLTGTVEEIGEFVPTDAG